MARFEFQLGVTSVGVTIVWASMGWPYSTSGVSFFFMLEGLLETNRASRGNLYPIISEKRFAAGQIARPQTEQ